MIAALGEWISRVFRRIMPDPFVLVVLLSLITFAAAMLWGSFPRLSPAPQTAVDRAVALLDAWRGDEGLWKFLGFGMQMCLVLLTGHVLAATRPVQRLLEALASIPRTAGGAAALVGFVACVTALLNWGLGLVVGALLARDVGRTMERRGLPAHYPLLAAAGYMGLLIWHGGLSGSAPLSMTSVAQAARVLPKDLVAARGESLVVPLDQTTFSTLNIVITLGLLAIIPAVLYFLAPRSREAILPAARFAPLAGAPDFEPAAEDSTGRRSLPDRLDRSLSLALVLAVPLGLAVYRHAAARGAMSIGLNEIIAGMFALGLLFHGSLKRYAEASERAAGDCAGIVIQFPLYGGILAMMAASGLAEDVARWFSQSASPRTLPLMTFYAASVLNMFITSGGGLWGVQGPIALSAGADLGIEPGRMVMAVAYGDQLTNMLQPFWALPLLAITGVRARDIVGYTCVVMLVAGVWISLGLVLL